VVSVTPVAYPSGLPGRISADLEYRLRYLAPGSSEAGVAGNARRRVTERSSPPRPEDWPWSGQATTGIL